MFGKCLKHDLRAIWRVWWIAAASAFGFAIVQESKGKEVARQVAEGMLFYDKLKEEFYF